MIKPTNIQMHQASAKGHMSAVVLLMAAGADPTVQNSEGYSCLHIAAQFGHSPLIAYLIARGVDPDIQDRGGMTALMWAAQNISTLDPVRLLLTLGASHSIVDNNGNSALHWAILARNTNAINTLIVKGKANLNATNVQGATPLNMLQAHAGAFWIGEKIALKIRECNQATLGNLIGQQSELDFQTISPQSLVPRLYMDLLALPSVYKYLAYVSRYLNTEDNANPQRFRCFTEAYFEPN